MEAQNILVPNENDESEYNLSSSSINIAGLTQEITTLGLKESGDESENLLLSFGNLSLGKPLKDDSKKEHCVIVKGEQNKDTKNYDLTKRESSGDFESEGVIVHGNADRTNLQAKGPPGEPICFPIEDNCRQDVNRILKNGKRSAATSGNSLIKGFKPNEVRSATHQSGGRFTLVPKSRKQQTISEILKQNELIQNHSINANILMQTQIPNHILGEDIQPIFNLEERLESSDSLPSFDLDTLTADAPELLARLKCSIADTTVYEQQPQLGAVSQSMFAETGATQIKCRSNSGSSDTVSVFPRSPESGYLSSPASPPEVDELDNTDLEETWKDIEEFLKNEDSSSQEDRYPIKEVLQQLFPRPPQVNQDSLQVQQIHVDQTMHVSKFVPNNPSVIPVHLNSNICDNKNNIQAQRYGPPKNELPRQAKQLQRILPKPAPGVQQTPNIQCTPNLQAVSCQTPILPKTILTKGVAAMQKCSLQNVLSDEAMILKGHRKIVECSLNDLLSADEYGDTMLHVLIVGIKKEPTMIYYVNALLKRLRRESNNNNIVLSDIINHRNHQEQTPVYLATYDNNPHVLTWLLELGGNPNTQAIVKKEFAVPERKGPLHLASQKGDAYYETLRVLLDNTEIQLDAQNSDGLTALHTAAQTHGKPTRNGIAINSLRMIQALIQKGANLDQKDGKSSKTPIHYIIETKDYSLIKSVFDSIPGHDLKRYLKTEAHGQNTALHIAAQLDIPNIDEHRNIIKLLLSNGADPSVKNCSNETASQVTYKPNRSEIQPLLKTVTLSGRRSSGHSSTSGKKHPSAINTIPLMTTTVTKTTQPAVLLVSAPIIQPVIPPQPAQTATVNGIPTQIITYQPQQLVQPSNVQPLANATCTLQGNITSFNNPITLPIMDAAVTTIQSYGSMLSEPLYQTSLSAFPVSHPKY